MPERFAAFAVSSYRSARRRKRQLTWPPPTFARRSRSPASSASTATTSPARTVVTIPIVSRSRSSARTAAPTAPTRKLANLVALDPSFVGRTFSLGEPYLVGAEKIREFASAIGDDNPISHSTAAALAAGHDALVAPPTFAVVAVARAQDVVLFDPALGLDFSRVVHGDQRFVHHPPIPAGDVLSCTVTVDAIRALGSNDVL